jgi:hypothetical protein
MRILPAQTVRKRPVAGMDPPCGEAMGRGDRSRSEWWRGRKVARRLTASAPPSALRAATSPSLRDREDLDIRQRPLVADGDAHPGESRGPECRHEPGVFLHWTPAFAGAQGGLDSVIFRHPGNRCGPLPTPFRKLPVGATLMSAYDRLRPFFSPPAGGGGGGGPAASRWPTPLRLTSKLASLAAPPARGRGNRFVAQSAAFHPDPDIVRQSGRALVAPSDCKGHRDCAERPQWAKCRRAAQSRNPAPPHR